MSTLRNYRALIEHGIDDRLIALERLSELASSLGNYLLETKRVVDDARKEAEQLCKRSLEVDSAIDSVEADFKSRTVDVGRLITLIELAKILKVSRNTLWAMRRAPDFPKPIPMHSRGKILRYRLIDVERWMHREAVGLS